MKVEIFGKKSYRVNRRKIKKIFSILVKIFPRIAHQTVSVALVNDHTIKKFNRRYRRLNKVTDVLSFGSPRKIKGQFFGSSLGEIIISYPQAKRQALQNKHSVQKELSFLVTHGCLHLLGFDHVTAGMRTVMEKNEARVIKKSES